MRSAVGSQVWSNAVPSSRVLSGGVVGAARFARLSCVFGFSGFFGFSGNPGEAGALRVVRTRRILPLVESTGHDRPSKPLPHLVPPDAVPEPQIPDELPQRLVEVEHLR